MTKLFAMEQEGENKDDPLEKRNQLLIEKLVDYEEKSKQTTSVTADLLKQRHQLRAEITQQLNEQQNEQEEEGGDNSSADTKNADADGGEDAGSDQDSKGSGSEENKDTGDEQTGDKGQEGEQEAAKDKGADEEEEGAAADDADSLRSMVGSGGSKDKPAQESFHVPARKPVKKAATRFTGIGELAMLRQLFTPLKESHQRRMVAIEGFALSDKPKVTEQPLVYVKSEVVESINRLIALANQYIHKNENTSVQGADGLLKLGEQLAIYRQFMEAQKFQFSKQLLQDEELLKPMSVTGKNAMPYTAALLAKWLEKSSSMAVMLMQNPFEQIPEALAAAGFKNNDSGVLVQEPMLPGFSQLQASLSGFTNYIETKYEDYQIFKVQVFKPNDLYSLPALSLDEDKDFEKFLQECDKILVSAGLILDNLKVVNKNYQEFVDSLKAMSHDVQSGEQKDLAGLRLDDRLKDFIKFKLVSELYINDLDSAVQYLTAGLSALANLVELSDK